MANMPSDLRFAAKRKWYQRNSTLIILFVLSFLTFLIVVPLGITALVLMWRYTSWPKPIKWVLTVIVPAPLYVIVIVLAAGVVTRFTTPPTVGTVAITAPSSLAIGDNGSVYVVDSRSIVHLSSSGALLGRPGPTDSTIATDAHGNLYYVRQGQLRVLSPAGAVLHHWQVGPVDLVAVDHQGHVYTASQSTSTADSSRIRRFTARGKLLQLWQTPYGNGLAIDAAGFVYAIGQSDLVKLNPVTGHVLARWDHSEANGMLSYDAVAADVQGTIYVGDTDDGDTPFAIQKLTQSGDHATFSTVNTSEESVGALAIDAHGNIYVVRDSYARPCPSNAGLDKLSPSGSVEGTFRSCSGQS